MGKREGYQICVKRQKIDTSLSLLVLNLHSSQTSSYYKMQFPNSRTCCRRNQY